MTIANVFDEATNAQRNDQQRPHAEERLDDDASAPIAKHPVLSD